MYQGSLVEINKMCLSGNDSSFVIKLSSLGNSDISSTNTNKLFDLADSKYRSKT